MRIFLAYTSLACIFGICFFMLFMLAGDYSVFEKDNWRQQTEVSPVDLKPEL